MILRSDITWVLENSVKELFQKVTDGEEFYDDLVEAMETELCKYFNSGANCIHKANGIASVKGAAAGNKGFKMRLGYPGCGKRGGLRLAIEVACKAQQVFAVGAWIRKTDPTDDEFASAFKASSVRK